MTGIRFRLNLFIPEDVYDALPSATKTAIRDRIRQLKDKAIQIGADEDTVKAKWHRCFHNETPPKPCEAEQDI